MAERGILNSWSIAGLAMLAGVALVGVTGFELWTARERAETLTLLEASNLDNVGDAQIRTQVRLAEDALRGFSQRALGPFGFKDEAALASDASLVLNTHTEVAALILTEESGRVIYSTEKSPTPIFDPANFVAQYDAVESRPSLDFIEIGRLERNSPSAPWFIPLRRSLHDTAGNIIAYDYALLRPEALTAVFSGLESDRFSDVAVEQTDGTIVSHFPDAQKFVGRSFAKGVFFRKYLPRSPSGAMRLTGILAKRDLYVAYRTVPGTPFIINVAYDANKSLMSWNRRFWLESVMVLFALLLIGVTAYFARRDQALQIDAVAARQSHDIIGGMASVVALTDSEGKIVEINQAFMEMVNKTRENIIGKALWELKTFQSGDRYNRVRSSFEAALANGPVRSDILFRIKDAQFGVMDTTFRAITDHGGGKRLVLSGVDVTERRNLEMRLNSAQRMETIGLVTSEIAHDFSNYISAISGFAEFLTDDGYDAATRKNFVQRILRACNTAKQTIGQILAYGRPQTADKGEVELCTVLRDVETVVHPLIAEPITFDIDLPDSEVFVNGSNAQLSQIFINLCTNARDALYGRAGKVSLRMSSCAPGASDHPALLMPDTDDITLSLRQIGTADPSAAYARIVVQDDGDGIDRATLERIFEPFYTTKPRSRGTGLGLAIIHGIVLSLDGMYRLESRPGKGTNFAIYLPALRITPMRANIAA